MTLAAYGSMMVASCGHAAQLQPNPSKDIDCSVVTFYFKGLAEHEGADAEQQAALGAVSTWYAKKAEAIAKDKGSNAVLTRAGPLLETVKNDRGAMQDELQACTDRAVSEGFSSS